MTDKVRHIPILNYFFKSIIQSKKKKIHHLLLIERITKPEDSIKNNTKEWERMKINGLGEY
ncbi:hypothetical protein [Acidiluteibacter ferrifornacis]|uniref:Uncharacterized protein n=1 Tax=Acidiluteibacter ferrifornacis TaxID=2692424 RepID=A0A6N9NK79_9FLAO|nr:hypothetical protein [Acidiluteibacter ferrifornacis]NBG65600.1 hypothetical protein [Acidiluteibacter ferrifornacis]